MRAKRGSILEVRISDGKGILTLTFFNQAWRANELKPGRARHLRRQGRRVPRRAPARPSRLRAVRSRTRHGTSRGRPRLGGDSPSRSTRRRPTVASWQLQKAIGVVLDTLPRAGRPGSRCRPQPHATSWRTAGAGAHPPAAEGCRLARRAQRPAVPGGVRAAGGAAAAAADRSAFEQAAPRVPTPGGFLERFDAALPFDLTGDQSQGRRARSPPTWPTGCPMNRLVQGEVGSGKTLVALRAMLAVADSGGQSALLAPDRGAGRPAPALDRAARSGPTSPPSCARP